MAVMSGYLHEVRVTFAGAEISQFYLSITSDQYVLWLYISMKDTLLVQEGSSFEDIMTNCSDLLQIKQ
jgi:hypothetical protein